MPIDINTQAGTLYVWGSNINSEIGLTDDQVVQNVSFFQKSSMKKAIRQTCFKNNSIAQVAAGNTSSVVLVVDQENQEQSIVFQGLATITKDEESKQIYFSQKECEERLDTIPSIPFSIDFTKPVSKIICGDLFAGILTAQGEVFTWGWNVYGQLGLKDTSIGVALNPTKVDFSHNDKIMDIACGFNNCIALTDTH